MSRHGLCENCLEEAAIDSHDMCGRCFLSIYGPNGGAMTQDPVRERLARYESALRRIAEADEQAHPLVKIALEALNP